MRKDVYLEEVGDGVWGRMRGRGSREGLGRAAGRGGPRRGNPEQGRGRGGPRGAEVEAAKE